MPDESKPPVEKPAAPPIIKVPTGTEMANSIDGGNKPAHRPNQTAPTPIKIDTRTRLDESKKE